MGPKHAPIRSKMQAVSTLPAAVRPTHRLVRAERLAQLAAALLPLACGGLQVGEARLLLRHHLALRRGLWELRGAVHASEAADQAHRDLQSRQCPRPSVCFSRLSPFLQGRHLSAIVCEPSTGPCFFHPPKPAPDHLLASTHLLLQGRHLGARVRQLDLQLVARRRARLGRRPQLLHIRFQ